MQKTEYRKPTPYSIKKISVHVPWIHHFTDHGDAFCFFFLILPDLIFTEILYSGRCTISLFNAVGQRVGPANLDVQIAGPILQFKFVLL